MEGAQRLLNGCASTRIQGVQAHVSRDLSQWEREEISFIERTIAQGIERVELILA